MSETTSQPAAPPDTAAIAARALESLEGQSSPSPEPTPAPASTPTPSPTPTAPETQAAASPPPGEPAAPLTPSEAEQLLREAGYVSERKPDGREHWIPRSKVLQMIESGLKKRAATLDKQKGEWESERQTLAREAQQAKAWRELMRGDPRTVLQRMAEQDQRYQSFLTPPAPATPRPEEDPEPPPDIDLGNGRSTYSLQGIRALREWDRRQLERGFDQRLKPLMDRARAEHERQQRDRLETAVRESTTQQLTRARSWPKFSEHEPQILERLQRDSRESDARGLPPQMSLHDVYMEVVVPTLTADHNSIRESVIKELNSAPKSTAVTRNGAEPTRNPGPLTTEEIARRALAKLGG